jgi:hypothetical protein
VAHDIGAEAAIGLVAAAPIMAAVTDPAAIDYVAASAGLSGAIVAGLRLHAAMLGQGAGGSLGRWQWWSTIATGALASFWIGPAVAEFAGVDRTRSAMLVHFLTGLLGSTVCDLILANRDRIVRFLAGKVAPPDVIVGPLPPVPAGEKGKDR